MGTFGLYISYGSVAVTVKKEVRVIAPLDLDKALIKGSDQKLLQIYPTSGLQLHFCLAGL